MAEKSFIWPNNTTGDHSPISVADTVDMFKALAKGSGVVRGYQNSLQPGTSGPAVTTQTGWGLSVSGHLYRNDSVWNSGDLTPTVGTTGMRLVLREDVAGQVVRLHVIKSAFGTAAIPAADPTTDKSIATWTITTGGVITLTDVRDFIPGGIDIQEFDSSGAWSRPSGTTATSRTRVYAIGGGGGGGGGGTSTAGGGGGGGGGADEAEFPTLSLGATETVSIGAGGNGNSGAAGGNGGNTSFGSWLTAIGGVGGGYAGAGTQAVGGNGGGRNSSHPDSSGTSSSWGVGLAGGYGASPTGIPPQAGTADWGGGGGGYGYNNGPSVGAMSLHGGGGGGGGGSNTIQTGQAGGAGRQTAGGAGSGSGVAGVAGSTGALGFGGSGGGGGGYNAAGGAGGARGGGGGGGGTLASGGPGGHGYCLVVTYI